jgi:transposase
MRPSGTPEALEARRRIAARLLAQGRKLTEVAAAVGSSVSSVSRWKDALVRRGPEGLRAKRHPGPVARLSSPQCRRLLAALRRGSLYWGFPSAGWTCPRVKVLIARLFGVQYHVDYVGTLLHKLGWSAQKPEQRARERNERAIAAWRRDAWPRLKKEDRTPS